MRCGGAQTGAVTAPPLSNGSPPPAPTRYFSTIPTYFGTFSFVHYTKCTCLGGHTCQNVGNRRNHAASGRCRGVTLNGRWRPHNGPTLAIRGSVRSPDSRHSPFTAAEAMKTAENCRKIRGNPRMRPQQTQTVGQVFPIGGRKGVQVPLISLEGLGNKCWSHSRSTPCLFTSAHSDFAAPTTPCRRSFWQQCVAALLQHFRSPVPHPTSGHVVLAVRVSCPR